VLTLVFDGREPERQAGFFAEFDAEFGRCDILANVIGGTYPQAFADSAPAAGTPSSAPTSPGCSTPSS
jgi:hypothetical protein